MGEFIVEVQDASVELGGVRVIEGVTLQVERGSTVAIIGPNGAGKTTLLRAMLGLVPLASGSITLFGVPVAQLGEWRKRVGYVPQRLDYDRYLPLTVREMLRAYVPSASPASIEAALHEVGIHQMLHHPIGKLSGGQLQRVVIALNLLRQPEILFLDEPATGVDIEGESRFYDIIERLREQHHLTVVLVSHDLSVVTRYASQVLCLNRRLLCFGPPAEALNAEMIRLVYGQEMTLYTHREHGT
ncbi:MAG: metal ABC transporter ATP-binding protein [bacterium]|nr:metal ABC transporter ATP-binding protein [bacterium]MCS7309273.1 metal ABC transporter ATP-binding protein [Armatimonadota bacterium]